MRLFYSPLAIFSNVSPANLYVVQFPTKSTDFAGTPFHFIDFRRMNRPEISAAPAADTDWTTLYRRTFNLFPFGHLFQCLAGQTICRPVPHKIYRFCRDPFAFHRFPASESPGNQRRTCGEYRLDNTPPREYLIIPLWPSFPAFHRPICRLSSSPQNLLILQGPLFIL